MDDNAKCDDVIDSIRQQCLRKGIGGIKGLAVLFRRMDRDFSVTVTRSEFRDGLKSYGIQLEQSKLEMVFKCLDANHNNTLDFREILLALRGPVPQCRIDVINEAFDKMDAVHDGVLRIDDMKVVYVEQGKRHPKYVSGEWTIEDVLKGFLDMFDTPGEKDGIVTRDEFLSYYAGVSCTIEDDAYFDLCVRSCFDLPPKGSKKHRT